MRFRALIELAAFIVYSETLSISLEYCLALSANKELFLQTLHELQFPFTSKMIVLTTYGLILFNRSSHINSTIL